MFEKLKLRGQLIKAFRTAEIYRVIKRGDRTSYQFPKIHQIDHHINYTRYAFSLLNGIDPELLTKKRWALRQVLGSNIEVNGSSILTLRRWSCLSVLVKKSMETSFRGTLRIWKPC